MDQDQRQEATGGLDRLGTGQLERAHRERRRHDQRRHESGRHTLEWGNLERRAFLRVGGIAAGAAAFGTLGIRTALANIFRDGEQTMSTRSIKRIIESQPTTEGAGVRLRRAFGFNETNEFDPFLLLDDFRNDNPEDYRAGFPWHPHRGIETITYVLAGTVEHQDSLGNRGVLGKGDVQWMTAGSGILHQEMPQGDPEGRMHGFQLWANLPSSMKMTDPRYQDIPSVEIPEVTDDDGTRVRIICGSFWGKTGPVDGIAAEPRYLDVGVPPGQRKSLPAAKSRNAFAYVFEGSGSFRDSSSPHLARAEGSEGGSAAAGQVVQDQVGNRALVHFNDGDEIVVHAGDAGVRFLLVSGKPIEEPVAWRGPIVMNTREELLQAYQELQDGTFIKHRQGPK
jgi:redox-sensitive bicupin YhaK (pirin superfamily)